MLNTIPVCLLLICTLPSQTESAPAGPGAASQPVSATLLRQVPQSQEEIQARIELARTRLAELQPTTQPTTAPADEDEAAAVRRTAREAQYRAWEAYLGQLQRPAVLRRNITRLASAEHIQAITDELAQLDRQTRALKQTPLPLSTTDEEIEQARTQVQTLEARVNILADAQARRSGQLSGGFEQQREQMESDLKQLRQQVDDLQQQLDTTAVTTTAPATEDPLHSRRQQLDLQIATAELALQTLALEQQQTELQFKQDERLLSGLREQLATLQRHLAALVEAKGRGRIETLQLRRTLTTQPADAALLDLELFCERVLLAYFQNAERMAALQRRVPSAAIDRLRERVALSKAFWDRVVGALGYRTGEEALELHWQAEEEIADFSGRLAERRDQHNAVLSELHELQTVRERVLRRFAALVGEVGAKARPLETGERARIDAEVARLRAGLVEAMQTSIKSVESAVERLDSSLELIAQHVTHLQEVDRALYWKRIASRDAGLLEADWATAEAELRALLRASSGREVAAPPTATAGLEQELFGDQRDTPAKARELILAARESFAGVPARAWGWAALALVTGGALGLLLNRVARWKGVPLAERIEEEYVRAQTEGTVVGSGLSARIDLLAWNMLGDLAVPLLAAGILVLASWKLLEDSTTRALLGAALGLLAAAAVLLRLVHHLFEADSPPHRPLPCRDAVAKHYRWWLTTLILFSLVVLMVPLLLQVAELAFALQNVLFEVYKAGLLLLLLLFLFPKQLVLGVVGQPGQHWSFTLASVFYPVLVFAILALLVLQVMGFGALVTFIGTGAVLSAAMLLAATVAAEYVVDWIDHYSRANPAPVAAGHSGAAAAPPEAETREAANLAESRSQYASVMVKVFARLVAAAVTLFVVLRIWNVPVRPEWLNWRLIGLGGLVVLTALVVDRVIFAALFALHRSGRLPENTANLIRRWVRGALTVLVVLTLVAVAGWQVDNIWRFLTTLLAMVAIGFVAVWSILSNILATLVILIWRPFNVGERIELLPDGLEGQVVDINFMYTVLKSEGGTKVSVPNNLFAQKFIKRKPVGSVPKRSLAEQLEMTEPLGE